MKHIATMIFSMTDGYIELTKNEYNNLKHARDSLFNYLFLETVFDYIMENYCDYEEETLKIATKMLVFHINDYFEMNTQRDTLSRKIVNLLTVFKMYNDQKPKYINKMFGRNSKTVKSLTLNDDHLSNNIIFQTIDFLRDYVQHRGFPIQNLVFSHDTIDNNDSKVLRHRAIPKIDINQLKTDSKMKSSVLKYLNEISVNNYVELAPIIKEYIQLIGSSHDSFRKVVSININSWIDSIHQMLEQVSEIYPKALKSGASIVVLDENDLWKDHFTIFPEFIERIRYFERKNRCYSNFAIRYASNDLGSKNA